MLLGEGKRKVGEACWSHAQCARDQPNTHCHGLVCICESGLHNYNGKCSRNIWEDLGGLPKLSCPSDFHSPCGLNNPGTYPRGLYSPCSFNNPRTKTVYPSGLAQWELIVVALVVTLFAFAVFVGCVYFVISRFLSFRKTGPSENLTGTESFKVHEGIRKQSSVDSSIKAIKIYETKLVNDSTVEVESQLIDEEAVTFSNESVSTTSTHILEPVRFITPLAYRSSDSGESWQSSRRSSDSQKGLLPSRNPNQHRFARAWSTSTSYDDSDDWFQPNRNHIRRFGSNSPAGTTRLPLLLRASTFSESDESP